MPTLIKNGKNYSGTSVSLTQAEYDALTETQKNDGTVYFITDSNAVLDASDVAVGSGTVEDSIGSIAVIETSPATSAHAVGTYLVYNGKLYKVTSAISANEQLVVGTNISAVTVGSELNAIANDHNLRAGSITGSIFDFIKSSSCPVGVSAWATQTATDSPITGLVSTSIINKLGTSGLYSFVFMYGSGTMYVSGQINPSDTALRWKKATVTDA